MQNKAGTCKKVARVRWWFSTCTPVSSTTYNWPVTRKITKAKYHTYIHTYMLMDIHTRPYKHTYLRMYVRK